MSTFPIYFFSWNHSQFSKLEWRILILLVEAVFFFVKNGEKLYVYMVMHAWIMFNQFTSHRTSVPNWSLLYFWSQGKYNFIVYWNVLSHSMKHYINSGKPLRLSRSCQQFRRRLALNFLDRLNSLLPLLFKYSSGSA